MISNFIFICFLIVLATVKNLDNGLADVPPLGNIKNIALKIIFIFNKNQFIY